MFRPVFGVVVGWLMLSSLAHCGREASQGCLMNHSYSSPVCILWQLEMSLISVLNPVLVLCYSHYKSAVGLIMSHFGSD